MNQKNQRTNRITARFSQLRRTGEKGLITFITAGDPDLAATANLVLAMEQAGADLIELGVPFSDPMADGPIIQRASERALRGGTSLGRILGLVRQLRTQTEIPLVLMTYYNPVLQYGLAKFAAEAADVGVDGVIVPDLPPEESQELRQEVHRRGLDLIPLVAPTSTGERLARVGQTAPGFIYCVSLTGVTGVRDHVPADIEDFIKRVRSCCTQPLAIGFGISNPAQAARLARLGDAVIVGSAIVRVVEQYSADPAKMLAEVARLVRQLKQAIRGGEENGTL